MSTFVISFSVIAVSSIQTCVPCNISKGVVREIKVLQTHDIIYTGTEELILRTCFSVSFRVGKERQNLYRTENRIPLRNN